MTGFRTVLGVAFILAVLLSMVNVSAYKATTVSNPSQITVVSTTDVTAALRLSSSSALVSATSNGVLTIDFSRGGVGELQLAQTGVGSPAINVAEDVVQMLGLFTVTNNGGDCQDVSVVVSGTSPPNLTDIYGRTVGGTRPGTQFWSGSTGVTGNKIKLSNGGGQLVVDFHWGSGSSTSSNLTGTFQLQVIGTKSATCP